MRWIGRLLTAVTLLLVLAAPPAAALTWALAHRPWHWPHTAHIRAWLDHPLTATTVLAGVAGAAGLFWLLIAVAIAHRLIRRTATVWRRLRRLALPTPAQATAGSMAGIALFSVPALTTTPAHHAAPPPTGTAQDHSPADTNQVPATDEQPDGPDAAVGAAGVTLPEGGGWLPQHTAQSVAAMANLIWLRRRQVYQPRPHHSGQRDDADLQPLPSTVDAVTTAYQNTDAPSITAPAGAVLTVDEVPTGMLYLDGPGALAAARGLLVTALLAAAADSRHARHVMITPRSLTTLIDITDTSTAAPAGLHITHEERLTPPGQHTGIAASRSHAVNNAVLRLVPAPTAPTGAPTPANSPTAPHTTVVIGAGPRGSTTWRVLEDGTLSDAARQRPARLCVLARQAATDLITLLVQAHATTRPPSPPDADTASTDEDPHQKTSAERLNETPRHRDGARASAALTVLGDCRLSVHGQPVTLRRSAALQVLVFLAIHRDGATATQLIRAVWPGLNPGSITQRLYATISDLRKQLQPLIGGDPIVRRDDRYLINPDVLDVDLWHLHPLGQSPQPFQDVGDRQRYQQRLIENYGELAAGYNWTWLAAPRTQLAREVIDAYTGLADRADPADAARLLHHATTVDPYNEDLHRHAIHTLEIAGDHAAAEELSHKYAHRLAAAGLRPDGDDLR